MGEGRERGGVSQREREREREREKLQNYLKKSEQRKQVCVGKLY